MQKTTNYEITLAKKQGHQILHNINHTDKVKVNELSDLFTVEELGY